MSPVLDIGVARTRRRLVLILAAGIAAAGGIARAEVRPLTLYEKTGRAPIILWGEVDDGDDRFASVKVLEVMKGALPAGSTATVRIVYRLDSFLRRPWQDRIAFATGERVILFCRPFTKEDGDAVAPDLHTLMWGAEGKHVLPAEGESAHVGAIRTFVSILADPDPERQEARLVESIAAANPLIAETSLSELHRQGMGGIDLIPKLVDLFGHPGETRRVLAMRLLARIVQDAAIAGREVPDREGLSDRLRGAAALDPAAPFRVEAVEALAHLGGEANVAFLRRAAKSDPDQDVRYAAEKWLLSLK